VCGNLRGLRRFLGLSPRLLYLGLAQEARLLYLGLAQEARLIGLAAALERRLGHLGHLGHLGPAAQFGDRQHMGGKRVVLRHDRLIFGRERRVLRGELPRVDLAHLGEHRPQVAQVLRPGAARRLLDRGGRHPVGGLDGRGVILYGVLDRATRRVGRGGLDIG